MKKFIMLFTLTFYIYATSSPSLQESYFPNKYTPKPISDAISVNEIKNESYNYASFIVALPIPVPGIQIGHREKFDKSAIDFSGTFATAIIISSISANFAYLKYLNNDNYYCGGGIQSGIAFIKHFGIGYGMAPYFIFGKENKKSFHQVKANVIEFSINGVAFTPGICYQYGFKF